jgi:hypothetical protein
LKPTLPRTLFLLLALALGMTLAGSLQAESFDDVYVERPNVAQCDPGVLVEAQKQQVLEHVNRIRRLHKLQPVPYDPAHDAEMAAASLIIAANQELTHEPATTDRCYSEVGAAGAATGNLALATRGNAGDDPLLAPPTADINGFLIDPDVPTLGHRRWLLNPFLPRTAYSRVETLIPNEDEGNTLVHGATLKIIYDDYAVLPSSTPSFVAYPFGEYPLDLFEIGWFWSFSVVADRTDYWANEEVDFSAATVRVRGAQGLMRVHSLSFNNEAAGLPNMLQWQVDGIEPGSHYQVSIANVLVRGEQKAYTYAVRLTPPALADLDLPVYSITTFTETLAVPAGEAFALYIAPPHGLPEQYLVSRAGVEIELAEHSSYVKIVRLGGIVGDAVRFRSPAGTATLQLRAPAGVDPLAPIERELEMPVYEVKGEGEQITAAMGTSVAVYLPGITAAAGAGRVRWSEPPGTQLAIEFFNDQVLLITIEQGTPGDEATITFGVDREFTVAVVE